MKKAIKLLGYTSIAVIAVIIFNYLTMHMKNEEAILTAFSHLRVSPVQLNLNIRGNLADKQSLISFIEKMSHTTKNNEGFQKSILGDVTTYRQKSDSRMIQIIVKNNESWNGKMDVVVDVTLFSNYKEAVSLSNTIQNIFKNYGMTPTTSVLMVGNFSGKLEKDEMGKVVNTLYKELKAKKLEKYEDLYQLGYTGYSSSLAPTLDLYSGEKKINLDIRLRYNDYENKTYLYLATPIIEIET